MNNNEFPHEVLEAIRKDPKVRTDTVRTSHPWFFHVYFGDYIKYPMAPFHTEMFRITEDVTTDTAAIMAFRGSAKSTIFSMSYPIWAVIGKQQRKHIWLVSQTQHQARSLLANIKTELENNELLRSDLGPFEQQDDQWGSTSLVIPKYDARITAVSMEQSIRGVRHRSSRPDLIIVDDMEDLESVKTHESRQKTYEKLSSEIFPAGDKNTRFVIIGNYLHDESAIARIYQSIEDGKRPGVTMRIPIVDENNKIAWPGKYPDLSAVEHQKIIVADPRAFAREFLLVSAGVAEEVIKPGWIAYYNELPDSGLDNRRKFSACGVDLAIKVNDRADYTAIVSAHVYNIDGRVKIFILPHPTNKRMEFPEQKEVVKRVALSVWPGSRALLFIEDVGYQASIIQDLKNESYDVTGFHPQGDKLSRLTITSPAIKDGTVLFPVEGCEALIRQLTGFGTEKHDDLSDAFAILILSILQRLDNMTSGTVTFGSTKGTIFDPRTRMSSSRSGRNYWNNRLDDWDEATRL